MCYEAGNELDSFAFSSGMCIACFRKLDTFCKLLEFLEQEVNNIKSRCTSKLPIFSHSQINAMVLFLTSIRDMYK